MKSAKKDIKVTTKKNSRTTSKIKVPFGWNVEEDELIKGLDEDLLEAWQKLRAVAMELGPQRVYASVQAIMFAKKVCYFFVRPKKKFLEISIFLPRKLAGLQNIQVSSTKEKYTNIYKITHADQVEEPLTDWIREAYAFAPAAEEKPVVQETEGKMKKAKATPKSSKVQSASDWRAEMLSQMRALIQQADPKAVEELKWRGVPTWSHGGIICTGETYKDKIKLTFAKGAKLKDPKKLFNASLEGGTRRAIDIFEGSKINATAFKALIREAVAQNISTGRK